MKLPLLNCEKSQQIRCDLVNNPDVRCIEISLGLLDNYVQ